MAENATDGEHPHPHGVFGSLKKLAVTLLGVAQTRLEILSNEIQEEKIRIGQILVLGFVALFFIALGIVFLAAFLTVLFWETHRLFVLGTLTLLFFAAGAAAVLLARAKANEGSRLFTDSLGELAKDKQHLSRP
ncbi:MAG: phage holin family protein [Sulfuricella sp.]|nr:phage holin family protein [Sulfuricella sp.]